MNAKEIQALLDAQKTAPIFTKTPQQIGVITANTDRSLSRASRAQIAASNRAFRQANPYTDSQKQQRSDAMRGKTLEEMIGTARALAGREARREAMLGKARPPEVGQKIAATRHANGSYDGRSMRDKQHTDATKSTMAAKASVRQDLKRKLGLGKSDCVPKELLQAEYNRLGL